MEQTGRSAPATVEAAEAAQAAQAATTEEVSPHPLDPPARKRGGGQAVTVARSYVSPGPGHHPKTDAARDLTPGRVTPTNRKRNHKGEVEMTGHTVPDLSREGIQRIVAALAGEGVTVHWTDETDYETYLDLHLRPIDHDTPLTLSWRESTGWVVTEHTDPRRDWRIDEADLDEVAAEVASIVDDLDETYTDAAQVDEAMRAAGWSWRYDYHRWVDPDYSTAVDYMRYDTVDRFGGEVRIWYRGPAGWGDPDRYPVSPERAVDLLVAIGVLPVEMHSLHAEVDHYRERYRVAIGVLPEETHRLYAGELRARLEQQRDERQARRERGEIGHRYAEPPTDPDRRCRHCGAATGLVMLPGNPLTLTPDTWECANGCQGGGQR